MKRLDLKYFIAAYLRWVFLLIPGLLIGGCGGGSTSAETAVQGWVSIAEPISSANLTFYDVGGRRLGEAQTAATGNLGSFRISVKNLPADFRIVASGGTSLGEDSTAVFSADYRAYNPESDIVYINPVTTMVSAYRDRHSDRTLDEATARVKSFLMLPDWFDIGSGLTPNNAYFSHRKFMEDAVANGGVNNFITQLIAEIDSANIAVTHPFPSEGPMLRGAGTTIAMALAEGAASYAGSEALGWGLKETGLWDPGDETKAAVENMQATLVDIDHKLTDLINKLKEMEEKITNEMDKHAYGERIGQMLPLISSIKSIRHDFTLFVTTPTTADEREKVRQRLFRAIENNLLYQGSQIHDQLLGVAGGEPLLELLNKVAKHQYRFARSETFNSYIQTQFDYFDKLQEWRLLLAVEYYHANGDGVRIIDDALLEYNTNRDAQLAKLKSPIPENTMIDTERNIMLATRIQLSSGINIPNLPGVQGSSVEFPLQAPRDAFNSLLVYELNNNFADYSNWRSPSVEEIQGFINVSAGSDCDGAKGSRALEAQGWPKLRDQLFLGSADYYDEKYPVAPPAFTFPSYLMRTYQVHGCHLSGPILTEFYPGGDWVRADWSHSADWIPVRTMEPNEINKYFY